MPGTIRIVKTLIVKGTIVPREVEEFKGIRGYTVKYFAFYYNN